MGEVHFEHSSGHFTQDLTVLFVSIDEFVLAGTNIIFEPR